VEAIAVKLLAIATEADRFLVTRGIRLGDVTLHARHCATVSKI